ncbi:MAG: hypothetical protein PVS3B2_16000 [Candidatus Dormibacteraceae bacterium]
MDLVVTEVREQRGDHRGLGNILTGMRGVMVLARLGVSGLLRGGLVRAAARAKDSIRDVVRTVVTPHRAYLLQRARARSAVRIRPAAPFNYSDRDQREDSDYVSFH